MVYVWAFSKEAIEAGQAIIDWDDPRIKTLPGYKPTLPRTGRESNRGPLDK